MKFKNENDKIKFNLTTTEENYFKKVKYIENLLEKDLEKILDKEKFSLGYFKWSETFGKRFHKQLAKTYLQLKLNNINNIDLLKSFSSIETHLLIELEYYESNIESLKQFLEIFYMFLNKSFNIKLNIIKDINYKLKENEINIIKEILNFFTDPKIYYYVIRGNSNLSNNIDEMNYFEEKEFKEMINEIELNILKINLDDIK